MSNILNRFAGCTRLAGLAVGATVLTMAAVGSVSSAVLGEPATHRASTVATDDTGWGFSAAVASDPSDTGWGSTSA
ncbi:hypothetical protein [Streptomyces sp. NPDC054804]